MVAEKMSVLTYVPCVPSCSTCVTCLTCLTCLYFVITLRAFTFLRASRGLIF